jgi:hypothetical protein
MLGESLFALLWLMWFLPTSTPLLLLLFEAGELGF